MFNLNPFFFSSIALALSSSVFAAMPNAEIKPTADLLAPSKIEKVYSVQTEKDSDPGIRFVRVDNGGSSDISSAMGPSRLYLTFHLDGEMFDIDGSYLVASEVTEVTETQIKGKEIFLSYSNLDETLKPKKFRFKLSIAEVFKEIEKATQKDFTQNYELKSTVGMQVAQP